MVLVRVHDYCCEPGLLRLDQDACGTLTQGELHTSVLGDARAGRGLRWSGWWGVRERGG